MAYIIFVQPAVLSGKMFGMNTGVDFGAMASHSSSSAMPSLRPSADVAAKLAG
jgi:hypothetical protein